MIRAFATFTAVLFITGYLLFAAYKNSAWFENQSPVNALKSIAKTGDAKSPLKIKALRLKGRDIQSNETFPDGDDWLSGLGMDLANASGKTITFFQVELFLPAAGTDKRQPGVVWYLEYGHNPFDYVSDNVMPPRSSKVIYPGDFIKFEMPETDRKEMNHFARALTGSSPSKVQVRVNLLGFNDGTAWSGQMARRDGNGGWIPLSSSSEIASRGKRNQVARRRQPRFSHRNTAPVDDGCGFVFPSHVPCPPQPEGCKFQRFNLFDELAGNDSVDFAFAPCQITVNNFTLTCTTSNSLRRIDCPIVPCGQEWGTCLMDMDCCSGFCNGGQCGPSCPAYCAVCFNGLCTDASPVVVDVLGDGFALSNFENGVNFDLNADGTAEHLSWTTAGSDEAWLALDRNGNGTIDNGRELFGNFTPQGNPTEGVTPNGFAALAEFDKTGNGGNGDNTITKSDQIFSQLRLWQDSNHNGVSEPSELHALSDLGLTSIDCSYKLSKRTDEHGNRYEYRAKVKDERTFKVERWAWDVYLLTQH
jgi:hypothetical protein